MQEFIHFLNQGWVGTIVGTVGLVLALFLYWRSRISGIVTVQSSDVPMIGGGDAVFPAEVEVRYQGTPVPKLISSTVWIWNTGKKTVRGADIVVHDPLQLRFSGEVLNVRIRKVSREAILFAADTSEERGETVQCKFEFLDPGDGGVLEVLHTGSAEAPKCTGTIIGLPQGPQYRGRAWGSSASSRRERRITRFACIMTFLVGLGMVTDGILGQPYSEEALREAIPFLAEPRELPSWLSTLFGLLLSSLSAVFVWALRRSRPVPKLGPFEIGHKSAA